MSEMEPCPFCVGLPPGVASTLCPVHGSDEPQADDVDYLSMLEADLGGEG